jgi:hypothetical protein
LPPVALAFKQFLLADGAALIESITRFKTPAIDPRSQARKS